MSEWIRLAPGDLFDVSGELDYQVQPNGRVFLRGNATLLTAGIGVSGLNVGVQLPIPARPRAGQAPGYYDWTGSPLNRNFHWNNTFLYVGYFNNANDVISLDGPSWYAEVPSPPEHTLENVQAGLADALRNIVGLRVYDFPSDRVETPAAVLSLPETGYDVTLGGRSDRWQFPLWVLVAKADDKAAYGEMVEYLEAEGPRSIRAMIEADRTLGGACDTSAVLAARPLFATVAGTEFLAVEFTLEVYT